MAQRPALLDWAILASLVVAWGSSFAMIKIAVTHLDAAWVTALRLAIAGFLLVPYAYVTGVSLSASHHVWTKFTWLGFIGYAAPFYLITWGTHFVSSGVSGLLMGAIPLMVVVLAHFHLDDERITAMKLFGFLLGFTGILVLIGPDAISAFSFKGDALLGELAILGGCVCYAVHAIIAKRLGVEHPVKQTAAVCATAAVMGLAFAFLTSPNGLAGKPAAAFWAVAGLGVLPTAIATLLMYRLLSRMGPTFIAYSNYLVPLWAILLGVIFLSETLSWNILSALGLVLTGIAVSRIGAPQVKPSP